MRTASALTLVVVGHALLLRPVDLHIGGVQVDGDTRAEPDPTLDGQQIDRSLHEVSDRGLDPDQMLRPEPASQTRSGRGRQHRHRRELPAATSARWRSKETSASAPSSWDCAMPTSSSPADAPRSRFFSRPIPRSSRPTTSSFRRTPRSPRHPRSRSAMDPARPPAHASGPDHDDVFSSPTRCSPSWTFEGLENLDSPSRTGTFVVSHADNATTTRGSGSDGARRNSPMMLIEIPHPRAWSL